MIKVDMEKARDIKRQALRFERVSLFEELDKQFMIAMEQQDAVKIKEIADKKQALRDITKHSMISKAKTPKSLAKIEINKLVK